MMNERGVPPFVAGDDGMAAGEAVDCFNPNAFVMRAERCRAKPVMSAPPRSAAAAIRPWTSSATPP
jgi:hypothetical protein